MEVLKQIDKGEHDVDIQHLMDPPESQLNQLSQSNLTYLQLVLQTPKPVPEVFSLN